MTAKLRRRGRRRCLAGEHRPRGLRFGGPSPFLGCSNGRQRAGLGGRLFERALALAKEKRIERLSTATSCQKRYARAASSPTSVRRRRLLWSDASEPLAPTGPRARERLAKEPSLDVLARAGIRPLDRQVSKEFAFAFTSAARGQGARSLARLDQRDVDDLRRDSICLSRTISCSCASTRFI